MAHEGWFAPGRPISLSCASRSGFVLCRMWRSPSWPALISVLRHAVLVCHVQQFMLGLSNRTILMIAAATTISPFDETQHCLSFDSKTSTHLSAQVGIHHPSASLQGSAGRLRQADYRMCHVNLQIRYGSITQVRKCLHI